MRKAIRFLVCLIIFGNFLCFFVESGIAAEHPLSEDEITCLKICEGIIHLFKQHSNDIWPGYDLSKMPFIVYVPEKWVLLFNVDEEIQGFGPWPEGWPDLGTKVLYHEGSYENLVGQLVFDFQINDFKTVAIMVPKKLPEVRLFGHIVHEAFHQFQIGNFGEIQWQREERYPILNVENTSLAYLEMRLLMDALEAMFEGDSDQAVDRGRQFVAVRNFRWGQSDSFISRYEQGQEIREGTARYVEMKSVELMKNANYESSFSH